MINSKLEDCRIGEVDTLASILRHGEVLGEQGA